jgi:3-deoxy-manno-octulosonate cytidylyltransferase (CMP-KDO synthetase)
VKTIGVIPARYGSTRLPGKPLMDIGGKVMIQHVYERAQQAKLLDEVIVATDDERIIDAVELFGGTAVLTSTEHPNGTSRAAEIIENRDVELIINIQGDEPLIKSEMIDELAEVMIRNESLNTATLCYQIDEESFSDPNVVKVVCDSNGFALYFSRSLIPFPRNKENHRVYEHIGIYAYTKPFLLKYCEWEDTPLSKTESLEQLKVLENGYKMMVIETQFSYEALSIDTKEDLERARTIISRRGP